MIECRPFLNLRTLHSGNGGPIKKTIDGCPGTPHTKHVVTVNKPATCVIAKLYEPNYFCFINLITGESIIDPFEVTPIQNHTFGMIFYTGADFNMEYALTCVLNDKKFSQSPKVIFNIGAVGPAQPKIEIINDFGATGQWVSTGVGENYHIVFNNDDNIEKEEKEEDN